MFKHFGTAIISYGPAFRYLFRKGMRRYLLLPVLLNLLLLAALVYVLMVHSQPTIKYLGELLGLGEEWTQSYWLTALQVVLFAVVILFFLQVYKYLVLILLAPFLAFLSERIEYLETGQAFPFSWGALIRDIWRALLINGWNLLRELFITLFLSILALIPVVGWIAPVLILGVQSYFYGYGLLDYNAERWRFTFRATERWMWLHSSATLGTGLLFYLLFLIPVVGWIMAPAWGTAAATLTALRLRQQAAGQGVPAY